MGAAHETFSHFEQHIHLLSGEYQHDGMKNVIIMIKADLSGFVVTMHLGLCEQYILGLTALGLDFLFCTCPHALWQQIPPELILIP